jgi:hypothetical protein
MHLPDIDAAHAEALYAWQHVLVLAAHSGEIPRDCEIQIADDSGDTILSVSFGEQTRMH